MGRTAYGVRSILLGAEDEVVDVQCANKPYMLTISENGYGKRTKLEEYPLQIRGGKGVKTLAVTEKTGEVAGLKAVQGDEDIVLIDRDGTLIRFACDQVSVIGRLTQGVKLMRVDDGSRVAAVELVASATEQDDGEAQAVEEPTEE